MRNSADPDQLASSEANWSESILFATAGHIRVLQDQGYGDWIRLLALRPRFKRSGCVCVRGRGASLCLLEENHFQKAIKSNFVGFE